MTDVGGVEPSHQNTEQQALCEQRRRLPFLVNRPVIGGAGLTHHITDQQTLGEHEMKVTLFREPIRCRNSNTTTQSSRFLCEQRRRLPCCANRPAIGGAKLSHHSSTEQQTWCEQRRKLPSFADRTDVSGAEHSHNSTDQEEQRARTTHSRAGRKITDRVEGSSQNDCPPVQYSRYPQKQRARD